MDDLSVRLKLDRIHCFDEGDGWGDAEPYLWTVFFKVDGETMVVNTDGPSPAFLQGFPTVVGTPGNHGNLGDTDVDEGDDVAVPAIIGEYNTVLKPIPLTTPLFGVSEVGGMIGCIVVLMEEDNTPAAAIQRGHEALDSNVRDRLAALLATLSIANPSPSDEDIEALSDQIGEAVKGAVGDGVSVIQWIAAFGNMDDQIGSAVFRFSHNQLAGTGGAPIPFSREWDNEGRWGIYGNITARALPRRPDCCRDLRGRLAELEKALEAQTERLKRVETTVHKRQTEVQRPKKTEARDRSMALG